MTDYNDGDREDPSNAALFRAAFVAGKPTCRDYGEVVTELRSSKLVDEESVF